MRKVGLMFFVFSVFSLFLFAGRVHAASLSLTHIGTLATGGAKYDEWNYTSPNPMLRGVAGANAQVTININTIAQTVLSDASGNWSYLPTTLTTGIHAVALSSGTEQYSFIINIGSTLPAGTPTPVGTMTTVPQDLPVTGAAEVTLALLAGAGALLFAGYRLTRAS